MRIVIAGAGSTGTHLVKMFTESNHDIVVIDNDKEKLQEISSHFDVMTVHGNATSMDILNEAEVRKTKLYVAVTNHEETNILSCIIAKKIGAKKTIARIDNQEYLNDKNKNLLENLGVDTIIYPEIIVSEEIANQLRFPGIIKSISFDEGKLFFFSIRNTTNSKLNNKSLIEIGNIFAGKQIRIIAIQRDEDTIIPRGKDTILPDDIVYFITDKNGSNAIQNELGVTDFETKNIMILGGSRIGIKLAKKLEKFCYVKLFEKYREKSFLIADQLKDTLVIHSEAKDADYLLDEGIGRTDAFVAVTGNSEINMLSCMLAKKLGVKKTYAEIENTDYLRLVPNTNIDYVVNKKFIAASKIYSHTVDAEILSMNFFTDTGALVFEFVVHKKSKVTKKTLKDLAFPEQAIIGGVVRNNQTIIATGSTHLQPDDKVVVFCLPGASDKVASWFK